MINYLTSPEIVAYTLLDTSWSPTSLLDMIANNPTPYNALIDTGALITGLSNYEVAGTFSLAKVDVFSLFANSWVVTRGRLCVPR